MNEKLKFNLNRLKKDFEDVIDELVGELEMTEERYMDYYSPSYVEELQDDLQKQEEENEMKDEKIEELQDKIRELEIQIKHYK